jgi:TRAP-type mannitol/chloroaromatic compound transport system substrate-binding protein
LNKEKNMTYHLGLKAAIIISIASLSACGSENTAAEIAPVDKQIINWKMTSTFPSTLTLLGSMGKRIESQIALISNGNIEIKFYEPGALAPAFEGFDAVSYGAIEAGWSTSGYWAGKEPALQLFGSVPFGPDAPEYLAWFYEGGGKQLFEEIYHKHNIHGLICGITPPEASGWFNKKFKTIDDLQGLKIRYFGLGGRVLEEMGASVQLLSGGDIMPALELGTIDGAEFSMPTVDYDMGFWQVADYYYFPGWHQQSTFFELMINLEKWNSLSLSQKAQIEVVCGDNIRYGIAKGEALQGPALKAIAAKGTQIETWPPEMIEAFRGAWSGVAVDLVAEDENFAKVWASLSDFRENYAIWRQLGYLEQAQ